MIYSILIYETPGISDARSPEERESILKAHTQVQADTKLSGSFMSAIQLAESGATIVRRQEKEILVTDGPFAETKELFVGLYLFECAKLEEAVAIAKRIVGVMGRVEIRPVVWAESIAATPE